MGKYRNPVTTRPCDVKDGDAFAMKVVAIAGYNNDYAVYCGPTVWSDDKVAAYGDKLPKCQAAPLFYVMRESGRIYRE